MGHANYFGVMAFTMFEPQAGTRYEATPVIRR